MSLLDRRRAIVVLALAVLLLAGTVTYSQIARGRTPAHSTPVASRDEVVAVAGDISTPGKIEGSKRTSDLVLSLHPDRVLTVGDNQYNNGSLAKFQKFFDPTWGRFKSIIRPTPGHHEYYTDHTASGYFTYFGSAANNASQPGCAASCKGYYSFDLGNWHLIALNTNHYATNRHVMCAFVACGADSAQVRWLRQDLAANTQPCVLAYWADPRWSSGTKHHGNPELDPIWKTLYAAHADLVLNGHEHLYERFAKQNPAGQADSHGIREITVGTGGSELYPFGPPVANSEVRGDASKGILRLTLHPRSYSWKFLPVTGSFTDAGTTTCNAK